MAIITIEYEAGDIVKLPFGEMGKLVKYHDLPWGRRWDVKIIASNGFNEVNDIVDFFSYQFELEEWKIRKLLSKSIT